MTLVYRAVTVSTIVLLTSCAVRQAAVEPAKLADSARVTLAPGNYQQLPGWSGDQVAAAVPAFVKSCDRLASQKQPDSAPLDPAAKLSLDQELLARFPEGYRHLAYLQTRIGYQVKPDMPGLDGPEVAALYARGERWLRGEKV